MKKAWILALCLFALGTTACSSKTEEMTNETEVVSASEETKKEARKVNITIDNYGEYLKIDTSVDNIDYDCNHDIGMHHYKGTGEINVEIFPIKDVKFEDLNISGYLCLTSTNAFEFYGNEAYNVDYINGWKFCSENVIKEISYTDIYYNEGKKSHDKTDEIINSKYPYYKEMYGTPSLQNHDAVYKTVDITVPVNGTTTYSEKIERDDYVDLKSSSDGREDNFSECIGVFVVTDISGTIKE